MDIYLASASPRRYDILKSAGYTPIVIPTDVSEGVRRRLSGSQLVQVLSLRKAKAAVVGIKARNDIRLPILAADTVVCLYDEILTKPASKEQAYSMLRNLSGRTHIVYTGVTIAHPRVKRYRYTTDFAQTAVTFSDLTDRQIEEYISTGEPFDKAGGYGIQGEAGAFVSSIDGDIDNVIGLPMTLVGGKL